MNRMPTRSAVVAAVLVLASSTSATEVLAQGRLAPADEVDARGAGAAGNRATSRGLSPDIQMHLQRNCPILAKKVDVEASLTSTGATLSFTTESGDVEDLRRRVRYMGEVYSTYAGELQMDWVRAQTSAAQDSARAMDEILAWGGASPWAMPVVSVATVDLATGARIFFVPTRPEDLRAVRDHTAVHQRRLAAGQCWIPKQPSPLPYVAVEPSLEIGGLSVSPQHGNSGVQSR